jgi:Ni/Fe-hydrogenase 1 B-type cytochrome subunit
MGMTEPQVNPSAPKPGKRRKPAPQTGHDTGHPKSQIVLRGKRKVRMEQMSKEYVKVYVWELPVRIFHWINAGAIMLLILTGLYIGNPIFGSTTGEEAYYSYLMGWVRYIHFFCAFVFTANLIFRLYWVFKGNTFATSNLLKKALWVETWETVKFYLLLKNRKPHYTGHNPLAQLTYWVLIGGGSIIAIFTGFYLYFEPQPESFFAKLFAWVPSLFGGSFSVRSWHHLVAWGFIIFIVVHVYLSFREDWLERNGTMSSIFTGYKTEKQDKVETHEEAEQKDEDENDANGKGNAVAHEEAADEK